MATPPDQTDNDRDRIEVLVRASSGASHRFLVAPDELTVQVIVSAEEGTDTRVVVPRRRRQDLHHPADAGRARAQLQR